MITREKIKAVGSGCDSAMWKPHCLAETLRDECNTRETAGGNEREHEKKTRAAVTCQVQTATTTALSINACLLLTRPSSLLTDEANPTFLVFFSVDFCCFYTNAAALLVGRQRRSFPLVV